MGGGRRVTGLVMTIALARGPPGGPGILRVRVSMCHDARGCEAAGSLHNGATIVECPEKRIGTASVIRDEYLDSVRKADRGDYGPLIELHERYIVEP